MTVNRVCGSGAQAIVSAAQEIMLGMVDSAIAGGMENMDMAPYLVAWRAMGLSAWAMPRSMTAMLRDGLNDAFSGEHSGWHTEDLAKSRQITREEQDRWASARRSGSRQRKRQGKFKDEIVPVEVKTRKGTADLRQGRAQPPGRDTRSLAKLHPAFRKDGTITAGNAPGLNSGASAMIVAERSWAEQQGLKPMARLLSYGIAAVEPGMFGLGPIPAVRQALDRADWKISDIERIEINEAFAAIAIAVMRELGLSEDIVNVEGGAIAHGHPIGATGAVLTTRLLHSMQRDGIKRGVVTLCIGGGQGIALTLESLH